MNITTQLEKDHVLQLITANVKIWAIDIDLVARDSIYALKNIWKIA